VNDSNATIETVPLPLQGKYGVCLQGGPFNSPELFSAEISQTGLVPSGAKSLLIDMQYVYDSPLAIVSLGGQVISMMPVETFPTYTVYGGDISAFAGQVETLTLAEPSPASNPPSTVMLDNIVFSNSAIPEPGVASLFALAAVALGWRVLRRRPRSRI
jgi:hypothetical protein